jgi:hypothetical protein
VQYSPDDPAPSNYQERLKRAETDGRTAICRIWNGCARERRACRAVGANANGQSHLPQQFRHRSCHNPPAKPPALIGDLDFEPIDLQGILAVAQRNAAKSAVTVDGAFFAALDRFFARGKLRPCEILLDRRVGGRLAHEDEMAAGGLHRLAQRLAREEIPGSSPIGAKIKFLPRRIESDSRMA